MEQMNVPEEVKIPINFSDESLPVSISAFRPLLFEEGEEFCCVLGPDAEIGIVGRGATPEEAMDDWDSNLKDRIKYHKPEDPVASYVVDYMKASVNKVG